MSNYPITDTGTIDMLGDEFPSLLMRPARAHVSPLMADVPGADTSNWSSAARPPVTAWEGADMDAYWLDAGVWRHCQTGAKWVAPAVPSTAAEHAAINAEIGQLVASHRQRATLDTVTDILCARVLASVGGDEGHRVAAE